MNNTELYKLHTFLIGKFNIIFKPGNSLSLYYYPTHITYECTYKVATT